MSERKEKRGWMKAPQSGFLQHLVFERVWIEGTMRIKKLDEGMVTEIREVFAFKYPEHKELCTAAKVKRVYDSMRPIIVKLGDETTLVELKYTDVMRRYLSLDAMQRDARQLLVSINQPEPLGSTNVADADDINSRLLKLHTSFFDWCMGLGVDIEPANQTRVALEQALEQREVPKPSVAAIAVKTLKVVDEAKAKKDAKDKCMSMYICNKQRSFAKKVSDLLRLHNEHASTRNKKQRSELVVEGSTAEVIATPMPENDGADVILKGMEKKIRAMESALIEAYEEKRTMESKQPAQDATTQFLGYFILPNGKVRHYSAGVSNMDGDGDAHLCKVLLAKYGQKPNLKRKWLTHSVIH